MMMKKIISVILTLTLVLSCVAAFSVSASAAPAAIPGAENYSLVNENKNLALYIDFNTGDFGVMNLKTGTVWYSNPLDWESDPLAQGDAYDELDAKIQIKYITSGFSTLYMNSDKAAVITERQGKDYILTFYFKESSTNFTIPIRLSLKEDYLHVELMIDKIKELGDSRILYVKMFPFFGAGGVKDNGYAFIPDGTGSLMEFNSNVQNSFEFGASSETSFFATNPTEVAYQNYFTNNNEPLRLPVYGIVKNGEAYMNLIESGAAVSETRSYISGYKNSYNIIYSTVNVRDTQSRRSSTGTSGSGVYYSDELPENYISRIYLMDGKNASYIGMAERYRKYLIDEMGMQPVKDSVSNALCVGLYGSVKKSMHFLGIPYTGSEALTTYDEASELIDRLSESKVDKAYVNYIGGIGGGLESTIDTEFSINKKLGNKKDLSSLIANAAEKGVLLSFDADLQSFYNGMSNVKKFKNTAYGLDSAPVTIFSSRISAAGALDKGSFSNQLINPNYMLGYATEYMKNASERELKSFSFNSIGATLYCAYNLKDESTRDESEKTMTAIYKAASEHVGADGIVSTMGGNGYAAPYVDNIIDAPVYASHSNISLQEVPFYQIVFRGYTNLASMPVNLDSEEDTLLLRLAETGMSLYYLLMDADSSSFHDTSFTSSYACALDDHYDDMIANYNKLKPVYDAVGNSSISDYVAESDDLHITTFSNGAKVYVNYGTKDVTVNGVSVKARDFTVVGGANA